MGLRGRLVSHEQSVVLGFRIQVLPTACRKPRALQFPALF